MPRIIERIAMRHILAVLIVGSFAGCAGPIDPDPEDAGPNDLETCEPGAADDVDHVELAAAPPAPPPERDVLAAPARAADPGLSCDCADPRCMAAWIDEHMGCGVCAHVACGGEMVGVCVPCDASPDEAWCLLPPSDELTR
jgi:hypothetical protein